MTVEQSVAAQAASPVPARKNKKYLAVAAKGSGIIVSGRLFAYGSRFLAAYLLARALGAESYGLYKLAIDAAAILAGIASLGLDSALVRYVAILRRNDDEDGLWGALQLGAGVSALVGVLLAVALFALSYVIADRIFHEPDLAPLLQALAVFVPMLVLTDVIAGATRGFKKMQYSVIATDVVLLLVRMLLVAILFVVGVSAVQAVIIFGLGNVVAVILLGYFLNKEFRLKRPLRSARREKREILSFSIPLWIAGLLKTFRSNIQTLILGSLATVSSVGIFAIVSQLNMIGRMSLNSMTISSKPLIAEFHARGEYEKMGVLYKTTSRWALTLNLPILAFMIVYRAEILGIFGREYVGGATALLLLTIAELINVSTGICGSIIDMTGNTRHKLFNSVSQLVAVIGLNLLLIPDHGLIGAAVATMVGIGLTNLMRMTEVFYLFRLLPFSLASLKPVMAALVAMGAAMLLRQVAAGESNIFVLGFQALLVGLVYLGVLLLLRLPDEEREILGGWLARARTALPRNRVFRALAGNEAQASNNLMVKEMTDTEKGPLFIGGPDRCGKTTMRAFLASHPNIAIPAVGSNMWTYFYGQYGDLADDQNFERCLEAMLHYKHVAYLQPDADRIRREFRDGERTYARLFSLFLIHFAEEEGKPRWGVQTGLVERYADQILASYPGAKIIQMVRDPRDRYEASLALWPNGKLRAGGAVARWRYSARLAARNVARHPDQVLTVRYESMVSDPEQTLRQVCAFLGETYVPDMLTMDGAAAFRQKITAGRDVPADQSPVSTDYIGLYKGRVPKADVAFIQAHAGREMAAYQYTADAIEFSAGERLRYSLVDAPVNMVKMWGWLVVEQSQQRFPRLLGRTPGRRMIVDPNYRKLRQAAARS